MKLINKKSALFMYFKDINSNTIEGRIIDFVSNLENDFDLRYESLVNEVDVLENELINIINNKEKKLNKK
jgi:hypothetical protein